MNEEKAKFPIPPMDKVEAASRAMRPGLLERLFGRRWHPQARMRRRIIRQTRKLGVLDQVPPHWQRDGTADYRREW